MAKETRKAGEKKTSTKRQAGRKPAKARPAVRKKSAAARSRPKPSAAKKLRRPAVRKGDRDDYLLVLTDSPDRVDGWELAQLMFGKKEGAGDILPPNGLGKSVFNQDLMDDTWGDVPIATCRKGMRELEEIVRKRISALGYEKGGVVYEMTEADFLGAVKAARWKFVKFVHVEDE